MLRRMPSPPIPYPLRMPDELREALKEQARKNDRSLHAEIIDVLQNAMGQGRVQPTIDVEALVAALSPKLAEEIADQVAAKLRDK
jgi:plasmid stability protein